MGFWEDGSDNDGCFETDVVEWCHRFTTDSITHFTTGKRIHAIEAYYNELLAAQNRKPKKPSENDLRDASKFFKSIKTLIVGIYFFIIVPPWRLRVELDAFFKKMGDRRLDLESLSDLVYTDAIIKESFRMFTPAPYTARNSTAEDIVADRVWPEGTQYIINIHGLNSY
ncbi:8692_t:CDS:2 [Funneliformis mosseae]|uniref:8692_t:CDS:1 n=1 Tax=Funneliformis mosseae TaxID=27381 RepID=A0A9N9CVU6_FUNMO|nr:8692_t:CDS:2 [Funneliformis mosseae]